MKYNVHAGESEFEIEVDREGAIRLAGEPFPLNVDLQASTDPTLYSLILEHRSYELRIEPCDGGYRVRIRGVTYDVAVEDERAHLLAGVKSLTSGNGSGELAIKSPMPGLVIDVAVKAGDVVEAGQTLIVVESMKMHNEFKAPRAGSIRAVRVESGAKVAQNTILLTLA
jgi:biotin carboxyl carrier protein